MCTQFIASATGPPVNRYTICYRPAIRIICGMCIEIEEIATIKSLAKYRDSIRGSRYSLPMHSMYSSAQDQE